MRKEEFKYLYRYFFIGFLPALLYFLGFDYAGSKFLNIGVFNFDDTYLKAYIICFGVGFWLMWSKAKRARRRGREVKIKENKTNLLTTTLVFLVTNLFLFILLQSFFNLIVYRTLNLNRDFVFSTIVNFTILSVFSLIHFFKTKKLIEV